MMKTIEAFLTMCHRLGGCGGNCDKYCEDFPLDEEVWFQVRDAAEGAMRVVVPAAIDGTPWDMRPDVIVTNRTEMPLDFLTLHGADSLDPVIDAALEAELGSDGVLSDADAIG